MKEAVIQRSPSSPQGTRGILATNGFWCHTLELPWRNNAPNISCVPAGEYECLFVKTRRPIGGRQQLYWLKNAPGRTGVLIHAGTFAGNKEVGYKANVLGCILQGYSIGTYKHQQAIFRSREAVTDFIEHMGEEPFKLIVRGEGYGISH